MSRPVIPLREALIQTFEEMAFLFLSGDDPGDPGPDAVVAEVRFTLEGSTVAGACTLRASPSLLAPLAANMLGMDESDALEPAAREDALKEAANVVCGHVLPHIAGSGAVWNVETPRIIAEAIGSSAACQDRVGLMFEEGAVWAEIRITGELR